MDELIKKYEKAEAEAEAAKKEKEKEKQQKSWALSKDHQDSSLITVLPPSTIECDQQSL